MKYILKAYSIWEYGKRVDSDGNPHQEDCIFPAHGQQKETDRLFILCDGMGGHEAGEVASSTVCTAMSNSVFENAPDFEGDFSDDILYKAISDAFLALDELPSANVSAAKKMGTTMTFLKFHSKGCTIAHMGDSRVYHIRPGQGREDTRILFKTRDHSLVNDLIRIGELTPEEAKLSKQKNVITRAMQPNMERHPKADVYHTADIKKGDYFYMCSDGMLEQMEDDNILFNFSEATGDDENKVNILTQATSQNRDNHTAIIIHILDVIDPLQVESSSSASLIVKNSPIMATVSDNLSSTELPEEGKNPNSSSDSIFLITNRDKGYKKYYKKLKSKLGLYLFMALLVVLLVLGLFFIGSKTFNNREKKREKIENPQKHTKLPQKSNKSRKIKGKDNSANNTQDMSNQENPENRSENNNSTSTQIQNNGTPTSVNQSGKVHTNAVTNGSGNNLSSTGIINKLNGEKVVPSDQQTAIDVANKRDN